MARDPSRLEVATHPRGRARISATTGRSGIPRGFVGWRLPWTVGCRVGALGLVVAALVGCGADDAGSGCPAGAAFEGSLQAIPSFVLEAAREPRGALRPMDPAVAEPLDLYFEQARLDADVEALSATVILDDGQVWQGGGERRFWWGSVGKAFTAWITVGLAEAGDLALDGSVSELAPYLPRAEQMTIRQLLGHTSGLANFTSLPLDLRRYHSPRFLVANAIMCGENGCPGTRWAYSNTNYVVLGLIIEAVEGRPYHEVVNRRLEARFPGTRLEVIAPQVVPSDVVLSDRARMDFSLPYAAAGVVGSSFDMALAWRELLASGELSSMLDELADMGSGRRWYGLGVVVALPEDAGEAWIGHNGKGERATGNVGWALDRRAVIAVASTGTWDASEIAAGLRGVLPWIHAEGASVDVATPPRAP